MYPNFTSSELPRCLLCRRRRRITRRRAIIMAINGLAASFIGCSNCSEIMNDRTSRDGNTERIDVNSSYDGESARQVPPSAQRVAARALALAAITLRGSVELAEIESQRAAEIVKDIPVGLASVGILDELERQEEALLRTPIGQVTREELESASWRIEGVGVLAWSLGCFQVPPYDELVATEEALDSVGWGIMERATAFLESPKFRPWREIDDFASHVTVVNWRVREFGLRPGHMNFAEYLRDHPNFQPRWLRGLEIVDGDLAIGGRAISDADPDLVCICGEIMCERSIAAFWLQGDSPVYSEVSPSTFLVTA